MASDRQVLPTAIKPVHYNLSLHDLKLAAPWTYNGRVRIDAKIQEPTNKIVINSHELKVHNVTVTPAGGQAASAKDIVHDETAQEATFTFDSPLPVAEHAVIDISFEGQLNTIMAGFSRARYRPTVPTVASVPTEGEYSFILSTQFEACDARRAFPCFDEPNLKASFDFDIEIPEDQTALSNMPVKSESQSASAGRKIVAFERTPIMSTYLLAWAVGDFAYVEEFTKRKYNGKNLPVRVYAPRGQEQQGMFALDCAARTIDLFSDVFKLDYPLPKSDLLAVPAFAQNAMENWGLVTYRTTAVLFDEKHSDPAYKTKIAYVVAHELAHQWFGNLVTMDWWSELWLNESFATWVGWFAVHHFSPDLNVWPQFVAEEMQQAYNMDSLRSSHPIEVPVRNAIEADQVFDAISYRKGCAVLRMIVAHLGQDKFLEGVATYLKAHQYGNAKTTDLWAHLSKASGQDIASLVDPWIRQIGLPIVTVAEEPGQITVKQNRFLITGDVKPEEDKTTWWIPLGLVNGPSSTTVEDRALQAKDEVLRDVDETFYKLNKDQNGFYRTNYPPPRLAKLGAAHKQLSSSDKIGLLSDATALAKSGDGTTPSLLGVLEGFQAETDYHVWGQVLTSVALVRQVFADNARIAEAMKKFALKLITPAVERLGWDEKPGEDNLTRQLRPLLLSSAGLAGHEGTVAHAQKLFSAYMADPKQPDVSVLRPNLRPPVFKIAARYSQPATASYTALKTFHNTTPTVDGREIALQALGRTRDPALHEDLFNFALSDAVSIQDAHTPLLALSANAEARDKLWHLLHTRWADVVAKAGGSTIVVDRFVRVSLSRFASRARAAEIRAFFADKDTSAFSKALNVALDTVEGNAAYRERDEARLLEWLDAHGYTGAK